MKTVVKENANGGKGQVVVKYILDDNELNAKDRVVFKEYSGTKVKLDGVEYIVIDEKDVLACIE